MAVVPDRLYPLIPEDLGTVLHISYGNGQDHPHVQIETRCVPEIVGT
jgi:hypothetical protein